MGEVFTPDESWGTPEPAGDESATPEQRTATPDRTWGIPEELTSSALGSFFRRGLQEIPAATAAGVAGIGVGGAATALSAPLLGPGAPVAGIGAGIGAALLTGHKVHEFQDWLLDKLGQREGTGFFSRAQEAEDREKNKWPTLAGEIAAAVPTFGTGLTRQAGKLVNTVPLAERALGAGVQGGLETGRQIWQGEDFDPATIGAAAASGAVLAKPRDWVFGGARPTPTPQAPGNALTPPGQPQLPPPPYDITAGPNPGVFPRGGRPFTPPTAPGALPPAAQAAIKGQLPPPVTRTTGPNPGQVQGAPYTESVPGGTEVSRHQKSDYGNTNRAETPENINLGTDIREGEITPPMRGLRESTPVEREIQTYMRMRDEAPPELRGFWDEHIQELESRAQRKGFAGRDEDASLGPSIEGDYTPVTSSDLSRANDVTTVAKGVAAENARAPQIAGAGNPVGAPMSARIAARPTEPDRAYGKQLTAPAQQERAGTTSGDYHPDIIEALRAPDEIIPPKRDPSEMGPSKQIGLGDYEPHLNEQGELAEPAWQTKQANAQAALESAERFTDEGHPIIEGESRRSESMPQLVRPQPKPTVAYSARPEPARAPVPEPKREPRILPDLTQEPPPEPVTAAVTPEQRANIEGLREKIRHTMPDHLETFDALPMERQVSMADEWAPVHAVQEKATYDVGARPKAKTGVTARSKADAERIDTVLNAYESATKEFGTPPENETPGQTASRLTKMVQHFNEAAAGMKYRPNEKLPDYQLVNAAKKMIARPGKKTMADYKLAEIAYLKNDKDLALANQKEKAIDTGIEKRPGAEPDLEAAAVDTERVKHFQTEAATRESGVYRGQQKAVMNVLNRLPDKTWHALNDMHDGQLDFMVKSTNDPLALGRQLREDILEIQKGNVKPKEESKSASFWETLAKDEGGSIDVQKILDSLPDWASVAPRGFMNFYHPKVSKDILDYGKAIGMYGVRLGTQVAQTYHKMETAVNLAVDSRGGRPSPQENTRMRKAFEERNINSLNEKDKKYWNDHVKPLLDKAKAQYEVLREYSIKYKLPGWKTMPETFDNGAGFNPWLPRRLREDRDTSTDTPVLHRAISNWATSGQPRDWFTAVSPTGERLVYHINKDDKMVFYKDRVGSNAIDPPKDFNPGQVGGEFEYKGKTWKVDNSKLDELMKHGAGEKGKPLDFIDNPLLAAADAVVGLDHALARVRLLDNVLKDPKFAELNTYKSSEAETRWGKGEFDQISQLAGKAIPTMKGRYMPKAIAWAIDDLVKQGFHYENTAAISIARANQTLLKPFYSLGGETHVLNMLDKFMYAMPEATKQLPSMPKYLKEAWKDVSHPGGAAMTEVLEAGGNPMYMHSLSARFYQRLGEKLGEDMSLRPWKYDPLMKTFGINSRDGLDTFYHLTNRSMWKQSDVLYMALYKAAKAGGMDPKQAVTHVEKFIDAYTMPTTVGKSIGLGAEYGGVRADAGRLIQKAMVDPISANFGRFSYGLMGTAARTVKNTFGKDSTVTQRAQGAAQLLMAYWLLPAAYQGLSYLASQVTGNPSTEFEKRGLTRLMTTPVDIHHGERDPTAIAQRIWSPAVPIETGMRAWSNRDFAGRKIFDKPGHTAEFAAGQAFSPIRPFSAGVEQGGLGFGAQRFVESNIGVKTPSPAAVRAKQQAPRREARQDIRDRKHPRGIFDRLSQSVTGR